MKFVYYNNCHLTAIVKNIENIHFGGTGSEQFGEC